MNWHIRYNTRYDLTGKAHVWEEHAFDVGEFSVVIHQGAAPSPLDRRWRVYFQGCYDKSGVFLKGESIEAAKAEALDLFELALNETSVQASRAFVALRDERRVP